MSLRPVRLAYFVTHPIQYQAPLLRMIAADPSIELKVFFATDHSLRQHYDPGFGREITWDVDLINGYEHEVLPAFNSGASLSTLRPFSVGVVWRILTGGFDAIWCHSYARPAHLMAIFAGSTLGKKVFLRDEAGRYSSNPSPLRSLVKCCLLKVLNPLLSGVLTIGKLNREFYHQQGIPAQKLFSMPYAVDNVWFQKRLVEAAADRKEFRRQLGIQPDQRVVLFAAKFQPRKRGDDLIRAFAKMSSEDPRANAVLLMVGEGEMDEEWRSLAEKMSESRVKFVGFKGMLELPAYFDLCDVFVIPSSLEPWGLVLNEVMNAAKPVISTHEVGSAHDLVKHGDNGYLVETGNIDQIAAALQKILSNPKLAAAMGKRSLEIIGDWSYERDIEGLKAALRVYFGERVK